MTRAAILIAAVQDDGAVQAARLEQSRKLWRQLGLAVDLVLVRPADCGRAPPADMSRFRRFGCLPVAALAGGTQVLDRFLLAMNDAAPYVAAQTVGLDVRPSPDAATIRVADTAGAAPLVPADLVLTRIEADRAALSAAGHRAVRLPLPALPAGPAVRGRAVGWIGVWPPGRAGIWSGALELLSRQGAGLAGGIVLSGPGACEVIVPDNLSQWVSAGPGGGDPSVLGLVAAPDPPSQADPAVVARALALGRPVLLGPQGAGVYEDRWHLPVIHGPEGLCRMISEWSVDGDPFSLDLHRTRQAFRQDLLAMTDHVLGQIASLLPALPDAGRTLRVSARRPGLTR